MFDYLFLWTLEDRVSLNVWSIQLCVLIYCLCFKELFWVYISVVYTRHTVMHIHQTHTTHAHKHLNIPQTVKYTVIRLHLNHTTQKTLPCGYTIYT